MTPTLARSRWTPGNHGLGESASGFRCQRKRKAPRRPPLAILLALILATMVGSSLQSVVYNVSCMQDIAGVSLSCAANDITLASVFNITLFDDGCRFPGDSVTFRAVFEVKLGATARQDIGIWISSDGDLNRDGAKTGKCIAATLPYAPDPPWLDSDGLIGGIQDTCGDMDSSHSPVYPQFDITVACYDHNGDNNLDLPYCTSWRQSGANMLCTTPTHATPAAPSKCNCAPDFQVPIYMAPCITTVPLCDADLCYSGGSCLPYGSSPDTNGCTAPKAPLPPPSPPPPPPPPLSPSPPPSPPPSLALPSAPPPAFLAPPPPPRPQPPAHEGTELSMTWEVEATESLEVGRKVVVDLLLKAATSNRAVCDPSLYSQSSPPEGSIPGIGGGSSSNSPPPPLPDTSPPDCSSFLVIRAVPERGYCDPFNAATCMLTCHLDSLAKGEAVNVDLVILPLQGGVALTMGAVARADLLSSEAAPVTVDFDGYSGPQGESIIQTVDARQPIIAPSTLNTQNTVVVINNMPRKILAGYASPLNFTVGLGTTHRCSNAASALVDTVGTALIQNLTEVAPGVFTFEAVPFAEGILQLRVPAGICSDASGQRNLASDTYLMLYDATPPQVSLASLSGPTTRHSPILFGVTFSERVFGFALGEDHVRVENGCIKRIYAVNETVGQYVVAVWPHKDAWVSLQLLGGAGTDAAGNVSPASEEITVEHYTPLTFPTHYVSAVVASAVVVTIVKGTLLTLMWGMVPLAERRRSRMAEHTGEHPQASPFKDSGGGSLFGMGVFIGHLQLLQFLGSLDVPLAGRLRQLTHSLDWLSNGGRSPFDNAEDAARWEAGDWQPAFMPNGTEQNGNNPFCFPPASAQELAALQTHLDATPGQPFTPRRSELEDLCTSSDFWGVLFYTGCELLLALLAHAVTLAVFRALRRLRTAKGIVYPPVLTPPRFEIVLLMLTYAPLARACVFYITSGIPRARYIGTIVLAAYPLAFVAASYYFVIFRLLKARTCTYVESTTLKQASSREWPEGSGPEDGAGGPKGGLACLPCAGVLRWRSDGQWVDHLSGSKRDVVSQYGPYFEDLRGPLEPRDRDGRRSLSLSFQELMSPTSGKADRANAWPRGMPGEPARGHWWTRMEGNLQACYMLVVITRQLMFAVLSGYRGCQSDRDIGWVQICVFLGVLAFQVTYLVILKPFHSLAAGVAELACVACQLGALLCAALLLRNGTGGSQAVRDRISGAMLGLMAACALIALIAMYVKLILAAGRAAVQAVTSASASYSSFQRRRTAGAMVQLSSPSGTPQDVGSELSAHGNLFGLPWSPSPQTHDTESASTVQDAPQFSEHETGGAGEDKLMLRPRRSSTSQPLSQDGSDELRGDAPARSQRLSAVVYDDNDQGSSSGGSLAWEVPSKPDIPDPAAGGAAASVSEALPLFPWQQGRSQPPLGATASTAAVDDGDDSDDEFSHSFGRGLLPRSQSARVDVPPFLRLEARDPVPAGDSLVAGADGGFSIDIPVYPPFVVQRPSSSPPDAFNGLDSAVSPAALDMPNPRLSVSVRPRSLGGEREGVGDGEPSGPSPGKPYGDSAASEPAPHSEQGNRWRSLAALEALVASSRSWASRSTSSSGSHSKGPSEPPHSNSATPNALRGTSGPPRPFAPPAPPPFTEPSLMAAKPAGKHNKRAVPPGTSRRLSVTRRSASLTELGADPGSPLASEPLTPSGLYVSLRTRHHRASMEAGGGAEGGVEDSDANGSGNQPLTPKDAWRRQSSPSRLESPRTTIPRGPVLATAARARRSSLGSDPSLLLADRQSSKERRSSVTSMLAKEGRQASQARQTSMSPAPSPRRSPPLKGSWTAESQAQ
eukprot:jgi/Mesvir1/18119/Mv09416-RA.1